MFQARVHSIMKYTFPILTLCCILVSCDSSVTTSDPVNYAPLMPLRVGNSWQYEVCAFDSIGNQLLLQDYKDSVTHRSVQGADTIYRLNGSFTKYANRADGIWSDISTIFKLQIPHPAVVGYSFRRDTLWATSMKHNIYEESYSVVKLEATNAPVITPLDTFQCLKYSVTYYLSSDNSFFMHEYYYYTPGVGLIQIEYYNIILQNREVRVSMRRRLKSVTLL